MASFAQFGNDLHTGKRSYDFVGKRILWYTIALAAIILSIAIPALKGGFTFGIEFTGGSEFVVSNISDPGGQLGTASAAVAGVKPGMVARVTTLGDNALRVQTDQMTSQETQDVRAELAKAYNVPLEEVTSSFIGATWGQDITSQALRGLITFIILASIVMALYFRTWKMSLAAMSALGHDLIIVAGVYGITGFEVTPAAVIGFLTILGYSLYDTVVVFDKIKENTADFGPNSTSTYGELVNLAVNQTLVRSINTSVVAALPVASILFIGAFILGAGTLRDISLALLIGIIAGTYSTIFIAAPMYAHLRSGEKELKKQDKKILALRSKSVINA